MATAKKIVKKRKEARKKLEEAENDISNFVNKIVAQTFKEEMKMEGLTVTIPAWVRVSIFNNNNIFWLFNIEKAAPLFLTYVK